MASILIRLIPPHNPPSILDPSERHACIAPVNIDLIAQREKERKREREDGVGTRITLLSYAQVKFSIVNYATIVSRIPESRLPYSLRVTDSAAQCSYRGRTGNERANKAHVAA